MLADLLPETNISCWIILQSMGQASKRAAQLKSMTHYEVVWDSPPLTKVLDLSTGTELLTKEMPYDSSRCSLHDLQQLLQRKMMLQHENLVTLKDYYVDQALGTAVLLYQSPFGNLQSERAQRKHSDQQYKESELWSLLKGIVLGFSYLQRNGIKHECVRLSTISICQSGTVKVADPQICRLDTNYELLEHDRSARVPLSPKEIESVVNNMPNIVYDQFKSDVYSAGVVLLELINFKQDLPVPGSPTYNSFISKGLSICNSKFSSELASILTFMLEQEEQKRLDWNDLEKLIESCQDRRKSHDCTSSIKTAIFAEIGDDHLSSVPCVLPVLPSIPTLPKVPITIPRFQEVQPNREVQRTKSPFSQRAGTPNIQEGRPPLAKPLSVRQTPSHPPSTPSMSMQPRISMPPPPTSGTRLNHSISQSLKAANQSNNTNSNANANTNTNTNTNSNVNTVKSNRIMASNISRERSLGRAAERSPLDSGHSSAYSTSYNQGKLSTMSVTSNISKAGSTGIPQISFSFQSAKTVKPLTGAPVSSSFESIKEDTKQAISSKVVERLGGRQTPINSIIVQDRAAFELLGSVVSEDQLCIVPSTLKELKPPTADDDWRERERLNFLQQRQYQQKQYLQRQHEQRQYQQRLYQQRQFQQRQHQQEMQLRQRQFLEKQNLQRQQQQRQYQQKKLQPQTQQDEQMFSFDKKLQTVRSYKDLTRIETTQGENSIAAPTLQKIQPERLFRLIPDKNISSSNHQSSETSNHISFLIERIPNPNISPNISDIRPTHRSESKFIGQAEIRELTQPIEPRSTVNRQELQVMSVSVDEGKEWSSLFRKNQNSKISVQIQTSPKRSISPNRKIATPAKARVSEGGEVWRYMQSSSRTVRHQITPQIKIQPKYQGNTLRGFRHGYGKYTFEDGGYYEGEWAFNRMQGNGKLYYASGKLAYQGAWSQDQIHGFGTLYNENPRILDVFDYKDFSKVGNYWSTYEGLFEFDVKNGNGTLTLCNGETYSGRFQADKVHGQGIFRGKNRVVHGLWERDFIKSIL